MKITIEDGSRKVTIEQDAIMGTNGHVEDTIFKYAVQAIVDGAIKLFKATEPTKEEQS